MKTNWEDLSRKLGVLKDDGSELYTGQSMEALEEILGDEWIENTIDCFIEGRKGNELAIKTIRRLQSNKAAEYAYKVFTENKDTNTQKASLALWAMSDIRMPICMQYVEECIGDDRFVPIAIAILRNLIYDAVDQYDIDRLNTIFEKINPIHVEAIEPLQQYANHNLAPQKWYNLLDKIQKRPAMYGTQKVEDLFNFYMGYSVATNNKGIVDNEMEDFEKHFTNFVIKDYSAPSHCNWCTAIRLYSASDTASVELFFEELAKYKSGMEDFDRIQYREDSKIFCCQKMYDELKNTTNNESIIQYNNKQVLKDKSGNGIYSINKNEIKHCPWCGNKLN